MFFIIQFHFFLWVIWWWIKYRWWKYNLKFQANIVPVGTNDETAYNLFETGDIILCRGEYQVLFHPSYYYALYCSFSGTIFSHVGIILKDHAECKLYILHCSPHFRSLTDFFGDSSMPHAFTIHELSWYVKRYKGTSLVRRRVRHPKHLLDDTFEREKSGLMTEIGKAVCHEYQTDGYRFVKLWTIMSRFFGNYDNATNKEVHCAEFAGVVLKRMGLLSDVPDEWCLVPDSFSIEKNPRFPGYESQYFRI